MTAVAPVRAVTMVTPRLPATGNVTGSPAHILKTCRALRDRGVRVELLELDFWPDAKGKVHYVRGLVDLLRDTAEQVRVRPSIIHCHGQTAAVAISPFARPARVPIVCEVHGVFVPSRRGQPGARPLLSKLNAALDGRALRGVDHVIAQAQAMKARISDRAGVPEERITVIYPGVNVAEFTGYTGPRAELPGLLPHERVLMYAGSTHDYQGLDLLARAQTIVNRGRRDVRLVLVISSDNDAREDVIDRFGFDRRSTLAVPLANSADLPAWLARADALVHARPDCPASVNVQSKLGLCLAAGKPFVTTSTGDYRDLLGPSEGCLVVAPEAQAIAAAIRTAVDSPQVRTAAAECNPALAREHFDTARNVDALLEAYMIAIDRRKHR